MREIRNRDSYCTKKIATMMGENPRHAELRMFRFQDLMTAFWTRRPLLGLLTHEPVVVPANNGTTEDNKTLTDEHDRHPESVELHVSSKSISLPS